MKITEHRIMHAADLRTLCKCEDWFTCTCEEAFNEFLKYSGDGEKEITTVELYVMALAVKHCTEPHILAGRSTMLIMNRLNEICYTWIEVEE